MSPPWPAHPRVRQATCVESPRRGPASPSCGLASDGLAVAPQPHCSRQAGSGEDETEPQTRRAEEPPRRDMAERLARIGAGGKGVEAERVPADEPPADRRAEVGGAERAPLEGGDRERSEEHTSELQSPCNLVCRLLLEKKKNKTT